MEKIFYVYFFSGKKIKVRGETIKEAYKIESWGRDEISGISFYEEEEKPSYKWNKKEKEWVRK